MHILCIKPSNARQFPFLEGPERGRAMTLMSLPWLSASIVLIHTERRDVQSKVGPRACCIVRHSVADRRGEPQWSL